VRDYEWGWRPYVSVAERRRKASREVEKRRKKGQAISPVEIEGRKITTTFWGNAWCENLERYSDYANRLPRGRTYVRNGSVVDLQIGPGEITALVSGSELYEVALKITPVAKARWKAICKDCAGGIDSLVELLQGRLSKGVMERICRRETGLFPAPSEIKLNCSCPDWASMCKHVAAVLYGVGARLDKQPELLFRLREVDEKDLIAQAAAAAPLATATAPSAKVLESEDLSAIFGLEMANGDEPVAPQPKVAPARPARSKKAVTKRPAAKSLQPKGAQIKRRSVPPRKPQ
jgi:uncharacterized Zn finger protein